MKGIFYSPETKKECLATIKGYIKAYSHVVECLLKLKKAMKFADAKRLMKNEIDKINSLLPEEVYIVLDLWKDWCLPNRIILDIDSPDLHDEDGRYFTTGNCFIIYPCNSSNIYLAKDRTFDYYSFCQAIDRLIEAYQKNVSEYTRALKEFSTWSSKIDKILELTTEVKKDAPEYFRYCFL